jgi:hypothetical protein
MLVPVGRLALTAAGIVIVLVGLQLVYRAWIGDVDRWLDLRSLPRATRAVILWLGRFGLAMHAIVFCAAASSSPRRRSKTAPGRHEDSRER